MEDDDDVEDTAEYNAEADDCGGVTVEEKAWHDAKSASKRTFRRFIVDPGSFIEVGRNELREGVLCVVCSGRCQQFRRLVMVERDC